MGGSESHPGLFCQEACRPAAGNDEQGGVGGERRGGGREGEGEVVDGSAGAGLGHSAVGSSLGERRGKDEGCSGEKECEEQKRGAEVSWLSEPIAAAVVYSSHVHCEECRGHCQGDEHHLRADVPADRGGKLSRRQGADARRAVSGTLPRQHQLQRDENGLEKCVACFLCAAACPANCIYIEAAENTAEQRISSSERYAKVYNIDYNRCIFCGYCVEACPTDAITHGHGFELAIAERNHAGDAQGRPAGGSRTACPMRLRRTRTRPRCWPKPVRPSSRANRNPEKVRCMAAIMEV